MTDILPPTYLPLTDAQVDDAKQQPTRQQSQAETNLDRVLAELRMLRPDLADKLEA